MKSAALLQPDWFTQPDITVLTQAFSSQQEAVRFVGGCVRDSLLGRAVSDIDMATSLPPEDIMQIAKAAHIKCIPTGLKHGTVTLVINQQSVEMTTLREDVACDGRHAVVEFTDNWQEDAGRRDFTMNALSLSFAGELFDYTGGIEDARAGQVRFIGDAAARIREDYLRILRFFRFFASYGKTPADATALTACKQEKDGIEKLSGERIQVEMLKLLAADTPIPALKLMQESDVLETIIANAEVKKLEALLYASKHAGKKAQPTTRLAALVNPDAANTIIERWKLSNAMKQDLSRLHALARQLQPDISEAIQKELLRKSGYDLFEQSILLASAYNERDEHSAVLSWAAQWQAPEFPVTGDDLIQRGMKSGKGLGDALATLEENWVAGNYTASKEDLLQTIQNK